MLTHYLLPFLLLGSFGTQDTEPVASVKLDKPSAQVGSLVKGTITVRFGEGLHAYQNPPTEDFQIPVKLSAAKGISIVKVSYPTGVPFTLAGETKPSMVYEGEIKIPVQFKAPAKPGKTSVKFAIDYQQCNASACFPPSVVNVKTDLTVVAKPKKKKGAA